MESLDERFWRAAHGHTAAVSHHSLHGHANYALVLVAYRYDRNFDLSCLRYFKDPGALILGSGAGNTGHLLKCECRTRLQTCELRSIDLQGTVDPDLFGGR